MTTYDVPVTPAGEGPFGIVRGPLDSQWFTHGNAVARIDEAGVMTRYPLPTADAITRWILTDRGGRVWFTEFGKIGWLKVSADGSTRLREYALPYDDPGVISLVVGPDRHVYFSEQDIGKIGRINPRTGAYREFTVPSGDPLGLTVGPDRALWYIDRNAEKVGRMTLDGRFRHWDLPAGSIPNRIVTGADGALWFTMLGGNAVGRITTRGRLSMFPVPGGPVGISAGRDGQLYVTLATDGALARVNLRGRVTGRWDLPGATFALQNAPGKGLDVWATDYDGRVYKVTPYTG